MIVGRSNQPLLSEREKKRLTWLIKAQMPDDRGRFCPRDHSVRILRQLITVLI